MPKVTWIKRNDPPIDWLMAAILERKHAKKITFEDLSKKTGYSAIRLKRLFDTSPWDWKDETRCKVCDALGIPKEVRIKTYGD